MSDENPELTRRSGAGAGRTPQRHSGAYPEHVRQNAQRRAERIWNLQRQVSGDQWNAFIASHPEYADWFHWVPKS